MARSPPTATSARLHPQATQRGECLVSGEPLGDAASVQAHAGSCHRCRARLRVDLQQRVPAEGTRGRQFAGRRQLDLAARAPPEARQRTDRDVERAVGSSRKALRRIEHAEKIAAHLYGTSHRIARQAAEFAVRPVVAERGVELGNAREGRRRGPLGFRLGRRIEDDREPSSPCAAACTRTASAPVRADDVRQPRRHREHGERTENSTKQISVRPLCSPCLCGWRT